MAPTQHDKTRQITGHVLGQSALSNQRSALRSLRTCGVPMEHIGQALHCGIALAGNQQKTLIRLRSWFGRVMVPLQQRAINDETACTRAKSQSPPLFLSLVLTINHCMSFNNQCLHIHHTPYIHQHYDTHNHPSHGTRLTAEGLAHPNKQLTGDV